MDRAADRDADQRARPVRLAAMLALGLALALGWWSSALASGQVHVAQFSVAELTPRTELLQVRVALR